MSNFQWPRNLHAEGAFDRVPVTLRFLDPSMLLKASFSGQPGAFVRLSRAIDVLQLFSIVWYVYLVESRSRSVGSLSACGWLSAFNSLLHWVHFSWSWFILVHLAFIYFSSTHFMSFQGGPYNQSGSNMVTFGKACRIVRVMLVTNHDQFKSNGRWPNRLALRKGWTTKTSCKSCDFVWLSFEETFLLTVQIIIMKKNMCRRWVPYTDIQTISISSVAFVSSSFQKLLQLPRFTGGTTCSLCGAGLVKGFCAGYFGMILGIHFVPAFWKRDWTYQQQKKDIANRKR